MTEHVSDLFEAGSRCTMRLATVCLEIGLPQRVPRCCTNTRRSSVAGRSPLS